MKNEISISHLSGKVVQILKMYHFSESAKRMVNAAFQRYIEIFGDDEAIQACKKRYIDLKSNRQISEEMCFHQRTVYKLLEKVHERMAAFLYDKKYISCILSEIQSIVNEPDEKSETPQSSPKTASIVYPDMDESIVFPDIDCKTLIEEIQAEIDKSDNE